MITVPTTLVLGAGASKPYGFPSGYELRQFLCDRVQVMGLINYDFEMDDINIFSQAFLKSGMPSIDAFLARRGNHPITPGGRVTYSDVGKAAIAYCLIQRERPEALHAFPEDHWYQYLWSFMADSLDSFGENKLRIITFNYDRSLEYYLLTALQHSFGISVQEAVQHLQKIPILHVYGQLAGLPELSEGEQNFRSYISEVPHTALGLAAKGIRVIDESRDDDEVFEKAYSYLSDAQRICFLGFGFDETNVRRLRIAELMQHIVQTRMGNVPKIFATTIGLEVAERQKVVNRLTMEKQAIGNEFNPVFANIERHSKLKAEQYLRATGVFIP